MNPPLNNPTAIYLVDDETLYRAVLKAWFSDQAGFCVVGERGEPLGAVDEVRILRPDVILLDVAMPGTSGIEALPLLREAHPGARVIMVTSQTDPSVARAAFERGAVGFVNKDGGEAELTEALSTVLSGGRYVSPLVTPQPPHPGE